ncbi:MAG: DUF2782 domain-containing protein [Lysobacteraceae bacterium]
MRTILPLALLLALGACATTPPPQADAAIPPDAVASERVMDNGDAITEYRVAGQLRMVRVQPRRGPAYFLYDRNGDGRIDHDRNAPAVYFELFKW